jgi:hypothetical protein
MREIVTRLELEAQALVDLQNAIEQYLMSCKLDDRNYRILNNQHIDHHYSLLQYHDFLQRRLNTMLRNGRRTTRLSFNRYHCYMLVRLLQKVQRSHTRQNIIFVLDPYSKSLLN